MSSPSNATDTERPSRLFKLLRRWLSGHGGLRSKHGAGLALDILAANGVEDIAVRREGRRPIHVSTHDKVIAASIIRTGCFAAENMDALVAAMRAAGLSPIDHLFVNVGANIGAMCLNAYDSGFRRLLAFEPEPLNFALLQRNLATLDDAVTTVQQVGIGAEPGTLTLHRHPTNLGAHSLVAPKSGTTGDSITVAISRLDVLLAPGTPFVLVADVEGFEPMVLAGAGDLLARDCRAMSLEITPARYTAADAAAMCTRLAAFADEMILLPARTRHRTAELPGVMSAHARGHFDIILLAQAVSTRS